MCVRFTYAVSAEIRDEVGVVALVKIILDVIDETLPLNAGCHLHLPLASGGIPLVCM